VITSSEDRHPRWDDLVDVFAAPKMFEPGEVVAFYEPGRYRRLDRRPVRASFRRRKSIEDGSSKWLQLAF